MALSAKEKLIKALTDNGFTLDPEATRYRGRFSQERTQNPNVYIKDATFGGTWRIRLEWNRKNGYYGGEADTLKAVEVAYRSPEALAEHEAAEKGEFNQGFSDLYKLENFDRSRYSYGDNALWVVMDDETKTKPLSVSQRAIKMVGDIETAVWLAIEETHRANLAKAEREVKLEKDRAERAKWTQSTLTQREFHNVAYSLHNYSLERADGKTDLAAELAKVRAALETLEASLVPQDVPLDAPEAYAKAAQVHGASA